VFAYLDSITPTVNRKSGLHGYRIAVVSDEGLPDRIEFTLPKAPPEFESTLSGSGPVRVALDLSLICDYIDCETEELNDGFARHTFTVDSVTFSLPGAWELTREHE
jgi:hypothetical protein